MKNKMIITSLFFIGFLTTAKAQVAIGKTGITNSSVLLEFGTAPKGIRLNPVENVTSLTASAGTIAFDGATGSFRYYNGTGWSTSDAGGITGGNPTEPDNNTQGTIIGATTSSLQGAVILEASDKAIVLPKVSNALVIASPPKGLMVYDISLKALKVYNGNNWISY